MGQAMQRVARRRAELMAVASMIALVGGAFLYAFVDRAVNGESNDLWPNPLFLVPLSALVFGVMVLVAMIFVPDRSEREQGRRDEVQEQILAALERFSPSMTGQIGPGGPVGPIGSGISVGELEGATGPTGPTFQAALRDLAKQGKVRLTGSRVSLITTKADEAGRVMGREVLDEDGHQDAAVMPQTVRAETVRAETDVPGSPVADEPQDRSAEDET